MSSRKVFWTEEDEIKDWNGVKEFEEKVDSGGQATSGKAKKRWIFRGERLTERLEQLYFPEKEDSIPQSQQRQNESEDYLETRLEKAFRLYGIRRDDKTERETELIRKFQRKAALYLESEPDKDDILEWLAIMRHHGAPTRLQDWGYSFYVGVYFALNANEKAIVWALDTSKMTTELVERNIPNKSEYKELKKYFKRKRDVLGIQEMGDKLTDLAIACYLIEARPPLPYVYPVNPFRLNKRLSVQQGLFLMAGDITRSFPENLRATFGGYEGTKENLWRVKIVPGTKARKEILKKLKDMNISNEALFPGLDGFARSVAESLAYPRPLGDREI